MGEGAINREKLKEEASARFSLGWKRFRSASGW